MLCALGFDMFYNFLKGELQGKKNQDLGKLPTEMEGKLVGDGRAILFFKMCFFSALFPYLLFLYPTPESGVPTGYC